MTLADVLARKYPMHFHHADGTWFVSFPDLPGLLTDGETLPLALEHADEARELYLTTALETGAPIPEPGSSELAQLTAPDDGEHDGAATMRRLMPGLAAVLARLEYGAGKHPGEPWRQCGSGEHILAMAKHAAVVLADVTLDKEIFLAQVEAFHQGKGIDTALALREGAVEFRPDRRKHVAATACRALMALTVDAATSNEVEKQAQPPKENA